MRHWKIITVFVLVFALLGAAYFFIQNYDPTEKPAETTPTPAISVLSLDSAGISQIEIRNSEEAYAFVRDGENWLVKNKPEIEIYSTRVESMCFSAATLPADTQITAGAPDLSIYGLDKPQAVVTLLSDSGATTAFEIGNLTPAGDGYYARLADTADVYQLSVGVAGQFLSPLSAFRVMTITAMNVMDIRAVTIRRGGEDFTVRYMQPEGESHPGAASTWHIESPIVRNADDALVQEKLLVPMSNLLAADVAADAPENTDAYGFTGDSVEISTETEKVRFFVGSAGGAEYVMPEGKDTVYHMSSGSLSFMTVTAFDVLEKMTNLIAIETVESIDISLPGCNAVLSIGHAGETMEYFLNSAPAGETAFKNMYMELAALSVDGTVKNAPEIAGQTPAASIVYTMTDGSTTTLAYYPYDDFNYAVYENGECSFYIKKTRLSELGTKLAAFVQNPNG